MTQQYYIAGVVVDMNNTPLEGVSVKIYRSSFRQIDQIGSARTEANGQYVSDFDAGSPVIVRYDHLSSEPCHPAIVSHISGQSDHNVLHMGVAKAPVCNLKLSEVLIKRSGTVGEL